MFFKRKEIFLQYEKEILKAIQNSLNQDAQELFEKQLAQINKIYRLFKNTEINMHSRTRGKNQIDPSSIFPLNIDEVKLGNLKIKYMDSIPKRYVITVSLWLVRGFIFQLKFNKPPAILKKVNYEIADIGILVDPMKKIDINTEVINYKNSVIESKFIVGLGNNIKIKNLYAPLSKELLNNRKNSLQLSYPKDWLEIIENNNGVDLENCKVYGIYHTREISLEDHELLVIVEGLEAEVLVLDKTINNGHIYLLDCENDNAKLIDYGSSFFGALSKYLKIENPT